MTDRILALVALAGFILFLGIIVSYVPHPDLVTVVIIVILMACYDFGRELFTRKDEDNGTNGE